MTVYFEYVSAFANPKVIGFLELAASLHVTICQKRYKIKVALKKDV